MTLAPPGERLAPPRPSAPPSRVTLVMAPGHEPARALRPPLELAAIGAALRARGAGVRLVDLRLPGSTVEAADPAEALLLWGESTDEIATLALELRTFLTGREFIASGPGLDADTLLGAGLVDLVLLDGEASSVDRWYRSRVDERGTAGYHGLAWRVAGGAVARGPALAPPIDPDDLPAPAWDLLELSSYGGSAPLLSGRSCGPECQVCHHSFGHAYRARSAEHVLAEVEELVARGVGELVIEDEPFNLDPRRATTILRGIRERGPGLLLRLAHPLRADLIDEPLANALAEAGLRRVDLNLEGVSPRAQRESRLNLKLEQVEVAIGHLARAGIRVRGHFVIGRPEETPEERLATLSWARHSALHDAQFRGGAGRRRAWLGFHLSLARIWRRLLLALRP